MIKKFKSGINQKLRKIKFIQYFADGRNYVNNPFNIDGIKKNLEIHQSKIKRTEIINYLLDHLKRETIYLEIGVRNPSHNFNHINSNKKYSVDPGIEFLENPVDFKMTSDLFFHKLINNEILNADILFDVIFIDGLHTAEQTDKDIVNALQFIKKDGFIVLHDCCPPTQWHAREEFYYDLTPAQSFWNGTTWKAFLKRRFQKELFSCCIDTDWGVGIISKSHKIGNAIEKMNEFYEFSVLEKDKKRLLNLISFEELKKSLVNK